MPIRNNKRIIRINDDSLYDEFFEERKIKQVRQYLTNTMGYPTVAQRASLQTRSHTWKIGDRYYKLAHEFYGDSRFWWVIAWYNQKPTEGHLKIGDVISIPFPLSRVMRFYEEQG